MKNFIVLSNGQAINLDQVAYLSIFQDGLEITGVEITFAATYSVDEGPQPLELKLKGADAKEFAISFRGAATEPGSGLGPLSREVLENLVEVKPTDR